MTVDYQNSYSASIFDQIASDINPPLYLKRLKWTVIPNAMTYFILATGVQEPIYEEGPKRWMLLSKEEQQVRLFHLWQ